MCPSCAHRWPKETQLDKTRHKQTKIPKLVLFNGLHCNCMSLSSLRYHPVENPPFGTNRKGLSHKQLLDQIALKLPRVFSRTAWSGRGLYCRQTSIPPVLVGLFAGFGRGRQDQQRGHHSQRALNLVRTFVSAGPDGIDRRGSVTVDVFLTYTRE